MKPKTTTIEDVVAYYRDLHEQLLGDQIGEDLPDEEKKELQKKYNENVSYVMKNELFFQKKQLTN